ncbi:S8 family serine peptidase [Paracoccus shanxieyensis]|uniref:S8 family serine peptidase n=1 Tax=Paracoccus shanxieyensis TaxID=2675752 RepID=A0A6L6IX65_9RHOB|nr:S8 family serine peptidase [Paracoccus shanxieyensis]MTH64198.1 S8 family serine peptidase [Paracoccus shanxieyensis]MTH87342.1 S8 family serine peptidase [Paracoccus shanxieyensis]
MPRFPLIFAMLAAMLVLELAPQGWGMQVAAAWADDHDDDDDDDDDAQPRRRPAPQQAPRVRAPAPPPAFAANEILVRGLAQPDIEALRAQGFQPLRRATLSSGETLIRLRKPRHMTMAEARAAVRARETGGSADFNHFYRPEQGPACRGIDCPARQMIAWPAGTASCGTAPRIGMVDTGINASHPVFADSRLHVHRIGEGRNVDPSGQIHGTSVAALLVGQADSRSPGLVPGAELIAVDAFHLAGKDERADAFDLIEALDYLGAAKVGIINLSLAGPHNAALARQVRLLDGAGIVMVAAAGNGGPGAKPAYPAAYEPVIAVTAVDRREQVYRRAGRGKHIDFAAPGVDIWTAASVSGARTKTGTSFAAPFVTAAAALLMQSQPGIAPDMLRVRLQAAARDLGSKGHDDVFGHGLVIPANPCMAVAAP